jgi:hypothetical protein
LDVSKFTRENQDEQSAIYENLKIEELSDEEMIEEQIEEEADETIIEDYNDYYEGNEDETTEQ